MNKQDMCLLKSNIGYNPTTGEFKRLHPSAPSKVGYKNKEMLIIRVSKGDFIKTTQAWRVAIYLTYGYFPKESDACVFRDGNTFNLKIDNLEVKPKLPDEFNAYEFAGDNDLSYQMVIRRMKGAPSIRRVNNGNPQIYYRLEDFNYRCADMLDKERIVKTRKKRLIVHKRNQLALDFLRKHFLTPTGWEMSLL